MTLDLSADLIISIAGIDVGVKELALMSASELGMLIAHAIHGSDKTEWSVPDLRAIAEASARTRHRDAIGQRGVPDGYIQLDLPQLLADGFGWLASRGLIGPASSQSGSTGEYRLTKAGITAVRDNDVRRVEAAYHLHQDLHPSLEEARLLFERGSYHLAVLAATQQVEVSVHGLAGYGLDQYGVNLMRQAFNPENGPLRWGSTKGEREAFLSLFAGSIGAFKNPSSHRVVHFDDPTEAADLIHLSDLLLRIAERAAATNTLAANIDSMGGDDATPRD